jgi:hypothetical protein
MDQLIEDYLEDCPDQKDVHRVHASLQVRAEDIQAISGCRERQTSWMWTTRSDRLSTISGHVGQGQDTQELLFGALSSFYGYLAFKKIICANPVIH